jgi:hypothetical protein
VTQIVFILKAGVLVYLQATEVDDSGGIAGGEKRAHVLVQQVARAAIERGRDKEVASTTSAVERRGESERESPAASLKPRPAQPRPHRRRETNKHA